MATGLNLSCLAAVCAQELEDLEENLYVSGNNAASNSENNSDSNGDCENSTKKLPKKRHASPERSVYDEIMSMSKRSRFNQFSELVSDELNKKYVYYCKFSPKHCKKNFKSYGNEQKAMSDMEKHLNEHYKNMKFYVDRREKTPRLESFPDVNEYLLQKSPRKSKVLDDNEYMPVSLDSEKTLKKSRKNRSSVKKKLVFGQTGKIKKEPLELLEPAGSSSKNKQSVFTTCFEESLFQKHTKTTSDSLDEKSIDGYDSDSIDSDDPYETNIPDNLPSHFLDHSYLTTSGVPKHKKFRRKIPLKKTTRKFVRPQFVIKTPAFPFVYEPVSFECLQITEINMHCKRVDLYEDRVLNHRVHDDSLSRKKMKIVSAYDNLMAESSQCDVTGSVLECVENKVTVKTSPALFKGCFEENDSQMENMENLQNIEKDLALRLIAQLQTQHKKRKKDSNKPLICQICKDKSFTALATLLHHYRGHARIKPFACKLCSSTFTRQHSLNYHLLIHQNRVRFTCEQCRRTFRHPSHYREHLRRHAMERPFFCEDCVLHFKNLKIFERHLQLRHLITIAEEYQSVPNNEPESILEEVKMITECIVQRVNTQSEDIKTDPVQNIKYEPA